MDEFDFNKERAKALETEFDKFAGLVGIRMLEIERGYGKGEMIIEEKHLNPLGSVHGGCLFTLADTIAGVASASMGMPGPTLSSDIYFIGPTVHSKKLICEAKVIKSGKRIRVIEAFITDDKDQLVAKCTLQYMDMQKNLLVRDQKK